MARSIRYCTVATAAYLPKVAVMTRSLKAHHPEASCTLALVEQAHLPPAVRRLLPDVDEVVLANDVLPAGLAPLGDEATPYTAGCLTKPALIRHLLEREDGAVVSLDPDMELLAPFASIEPQLAEGAVLLTPHLLAPANATTGVPQDERNCFTYGTYNAGFIAVGPGPGARDFVEWWTARVQALCTTDAPGNPYTDQGWLDLAPGMFDAVRVLRHPGFNVATWNAEQRVIARGRDGALTIAGMPVVLCHFSGWDSGHHRHAVDRLRGANPEFGALSDAFGERLRAQEALFGPAPPWSYGS